MNSPPQFKLIAQFFIFLLLFQGATRVLERVPQFLSKPPSGRVLLEEFDIKGANLVSLRQQTGVVLQEDFLFSGSVFENISFNNPDISSEQVVEAAKMAAHDFISELPQGYET